MEETFVNKVAQSGLVSLDLENYYPKEEIAIFDLKQYLFMELILKEKDFREALKNIDWTFYENKIVAVTCSTDAIIPKWAYMLVASYLQPYARDIIFGNEEQALSHAFEKAIKDIPVEEFSGKRIMIKGCGDKKIPESAYLEITKVLLPVVKSIMYGEACSTVPIYKKK